MKLKIARSAQYSLMKGCTCPKGTENQCGINYRSG